MSDFRAALSLLTIVPLAARAADDRHALRARAYAYFPFVGALLGISLAAAFHFSRAFFPEPVSAALVVTLWVILTGALHLDGCADAADGLFAATTRGRRLEIIRDPHVGVFGMVAIGLVLLLKFAAARDELCLFLAPVLGRWAMVFGAAFPLARLDGMAAQARAGLGRREILIATALAAVAVGALGWRGIGAWLAAVLVAFVIARIALNRLGGLTGDVYGMIAESTEVSVLLAGHLMARWS